MTSRMNFILRLSLVFLWLFTAFASSFFAPEIGYEVLAYGGITGYFATLCIYAGSLLDAVLAIWLLSGRELKTCYLMQIFVISIYSVLLTVIAASFWLHPFGPITKNIPLLAMIYFLYSNEK